ncbi:major facilitator superfamily transporter [Seiridium cupressi]
MSTERNSATHKGAIEEIEKGDAGADVIDRHDKHLTRKVLWKLDTRILPVLALLFLCSFLDRTNVGNARLYNLEQDLGITDHQYDQGLAVFYATYIASEVPSNLVLKRVTPSIWLPLLAFAWGIVAMCLGFIQNFAGFVTVRALLGVTEGGLLPGMILYLSGIYRREELALRIGLFYTAASLSGAFGGLLAYGIAQIGNRGGLSSWRWIFVIEGLLTAVVGIVVYFVLPNGLATAKFLTPEEREFAMNRLKTGTDSNGIREHESAEKFSWSEVARGVFSWQTWLTACAYFGILAGLYSFGLFLPTIINALGGYTVSETQLWSVIPYAVAAVCTVIVAFLSDRLRIRGIIMLFTLPIAIIGYAVIANVSDPHVKYGMTFLMATGMYCSVPPVLGWLSNNSAGHYKRATTSALQLAIANCGGFVTVFVYPKAQGPQYREGHSIILGLLVAGWFLILFNVLYCWKINRDKAQGNHASPGYTKASAQVKPALARFASDATEKKVGLPAWITLSTAVSATLNCPEAMTSVFHIANESSTSRSPVQNAELIREVGLKCISFNGIPRSINCLGAFHGSLPSDITSQLQTKPTRELTPQNLEIRKKDGLALWDSVYLGFERKLLDKLARSHPDLPVHIINGHYSNLLGNARGEKAGATVGRVLTSLVAIACLRAQTGVGPQVVSHIFGLRKAYEQGDATAEAEEEVQGGQWLAGEEGNIWLLQHIDSLVEAISGGSGTTFAPGLRPKL